MGLHHLSKMLAEAGAEREADLPLQGPARLAPSHGHVTQPSHWEQAHGWAWGEAQGKEEGQKCMSGNCKKRSSK